jgi:hypothetical protein
MLETTKLYVGTAQTTDATPTVALTIPIPTSSVFMLSVFGQCRVTAGGLSGLGLASFIDGAGRRAAVGSPVWVESRHDDVLNTVNFPAYAVSASGNDIIVTVTGNAATDVDWQIHAELILL